MFTPEMMAAAQKMMNTMSPEQLASIAKSMGGPAPSADDIKKASEMMKNMSPDDISKTVSDAQKAGVKIPGMPGVSTSSPSSAERSASQIAKEDGTMLFKKGDYEGALWKYNQSLSLNSTMDDAVDRGFQVSVLSNICFCHVKLNQWGSAVSSANQVLSLDPENFKALYRRGLAYKELGQKSRAKADFEKAGKLNPSDAAIQDELAKLREEEVSKEDEESQTNDEPVEESVQPPIELPIPATKNPNPNQIPMVPHSSMQALFENKELMNSVADMMKKMNRDDLQKMQEMAMSSGLAGNGMGGVPSIDPSAVEKMLDSMPEGLFEQVLNEQGVKMSGKTAKRVSQVMIKLLKIWLFIKSQQVAFIIAIAIVLIAVIAKFYIF
jgi:tetratricopeptide (TPR) repeat protein